MARTLKCRNELSKSSWERAINTANYILNRCLIRPILKKTSYDYSKVRNQMCFQAFGSKFFIHNNDKKNLGKFDAMSDEHIFVGYSSVSKTYFVYNKCTNVIEKSIHVVFDETNNGLASTSSFDKF